MNGWSNERWLSDRLSSISIFAVCIFCTLYAQREPRAGASVFNQKWYQWFSLCIFYPSLFLRSRLEHQDTIPWSNSLVENYIESFQQPPAPDVLCSSRTGQPAGSATAIQRIRRYFRRRKKKQYALMVRLLRRSVQYDQAWSVTTRALILSVLDPHGSLEQKQNSVFFIIIK